MSGQADFRGLGVAAFESRMAEQMTRLIERYGGCPFVAPSMRELPLEENPQALAFGEQLMNGQCAILILLTGVGTKTLIDVLGTRWSLDAITQALSRTIVVARGPKPVAVLKELGLTPRIVVPEPNTWRDVLSALDSFRPEGLAGLRVAVQEYGVSNPDLLAALEARGAEVVPVPVYRWALPDDIGPLRSVLQAIIRGEVHVVLVTNAVQVDHVMTVLERDGCVEPFRAALSRIVVASIGQIASARLKQYGFPVDLEPSHPKMGLLVKETAERAHAVLEKKRSPG